MKEIVSIPRLEFEEKKAIKLFITLFYSFLFIFEIFFNFLSPDRPKDQLAFLHKGLGIWVYIIILSLLPISTYLIKKQKVFVIKYMFLYTYLITNFIQNMLVYYGTDKPFEEGNIAEILFVLFSPIFINKRFFWIASIGSIGKYLLIGLILHDSHVFIPSLIFCVFSAISFIILNRFFSYINSLTLIHEDLRQKEKLAVVGQMATAIGHEIRNPLASLKGFTQLQQESNPEGNAFYSIMIQEIDRINSIVTDLMYLGKPRAKKLKQENIEEIISYILSISQPLAQRQGINLVTVFEDSLPHIECDADQLKQVFINLIKNAIEAMPDGGNIQINIKVIEDNRLLISVKDEGYGIPEEHLENIGTPFYTTKMEGTGLGLMVSNQIIKDHKGELIFDSFLGLGTRVDIKVPISQH
ncbi:ATP-binding protein [Neobacillus sp. PS3-34]|uniref:ATP-binding protein n=1 Tax=Neobacillus sp. PS3-34 TaxID=3070678 RepID=UPI0027E1779C|nr:ATP-binding protein [Neobacillus sp. PS3-34]WML49915.1 ATP-binding protein [Neobacillus sp. PS3-34]